jgi:hypothetical protein
MGISRLRDGVSGWWYESAAVEGGQGIFIGVWMEI